MKRIYISGPMTGLANLNFDAFRSAARRFREAGFAVVSPAEMSGLTEKTWKQYMESDIRLLLECDALAVLPNWRASKGAVLEVAVATQLGLDIYCANSMRQIQMKCDMLFKESP
ncbi:MAG TPA: DUF4406 domain-containing protein [Drouetiella sp.]